MRTVKCGNSNCKAYSREIEVEDDGTAVICGGCSAILAEQDLSKYKPGNI